MTTSITTYPNEYKNSNFLSIINICLRCTTCLFLKTKIQCKLFSVKQATLKNMQQCPIHTSLNRVHGTLGKKTQAYRNLHIQSSESMEERRQKGVMLAERKNKISHQVKSHHPLVTTAGCKLFLSTGVEMTGQQLVRYL